MFILQFLLQKLKSQSIHRLNLILSLWSIFKNEVIKTYLQCLYRKAPTRCRKISDC